MTKDDKTIEIELDRTRINMYRNSKIYEKFKEIENIKVRLVKYKVSTRKTEYLLTNLSADEFNMDKTDEL